MAEKKELKKRPNRPRRAFPRESVGYEGDVSMMPGSSQSDESMFDSTFTVYQPKPTVNLTLMESEAVKGHKTSALNTSSLCRNTDTLLRRMDQTHSKSDQSNHSKEEILNNHSQHEETKSPNHSKEEISIHHSKHEESSVLKLSKVEESLPTENPKANESLPSNISNGDKTFSRPLKIRVVKSTSGVPNLESTRLSNALDPRPSIEMSMVFSQEDKENSTKKNTFEDDKTLKFSEKTLVGNSDNNLTIDINRHVESPILKEATAQADEMLDQVEVSDAEDFDDEYDLEGEELKKESEAIVEVEKSSLGVTTASKEMAPTASDTTFQENIDIDEYDSEEEVNEEFEEIEEEEESSLGVTTALKELAPTASDVTFQENIDFDDTIAMASDSERVEEEEGLEELGLQKVARIHRRRSKFLFVFKQKVEDSEDEIVVNSDDLNEAEGSIMYETKTTNITQDIDEHSHAKTSESYKSCMKTDEKSQEESELYEDIIGSEDVGLETVHDMNYDESSEVITQTLDNMTLQSKVEDMTHVIHTSIKSQPKKKRRISSDDDDDDDETFHQGPYNIIPESAKKVYQSARKINHRVSHAILEASEHTGINMTEGTITLNDSSAYSRSMVTSPKNDQRNVQQTLNSFSMSLVPQQDVLYLEEINDQTLHPYNRDDMTSKLLDIFNRNVFENKVPSNLKIEWNARIRKNAGQYIPGDSKEDDLIKLSTKHIQTVQRLIHSLMHELCHFAVRRIDKAIDSTHKKTFGTWARKCQKVFPQLPPLSEKHDFDDIDFTYECVKCHKQTNEVSPIYDLVVKRCSKCESTLKLTAFGSLWQIFDSETKKVTTKTNFEQPHY